MIAGAEKFAETKAGGISGIEADDKTGEIVIHLTAPQGTFTNLLALLFAAPVPADTPAKPASKTRRRPPGPTRSSSSNPGRGWSYARNPQWDKTNAALVTEVPRGHVDKIEAKVVSNQSTQVNDIEQGKANWMFRRRSARPRRRSEGQIRRQPVPDRAHDRRRLRLDEHDPAALRRPEGAPSRQLRGRPEAARTDLRRRNHGDPPDHPAGGPRVRGVRPLPASTWPKPSSCSKRPTRRTSTSPSGPKASTPKRANTSNRRSTKSASTPS